MSKIDICKSGLYIVGLSAVIESTNHTHPKPLFVDGRLSDAFVWIIEGGCTYTFDDGDHFSVTAGDILYLASGAVYRMDVDPGDYHFIFCNFDFLSHERRKSAVYTPKNQSEVEHIFRKLRRAHATAADSQAECLSLLYRIYSIVTQTAHASYVGQSSRQRIAAVRDLIDGNCHDHELSVASLAARQGMSEVYLRKLFRSLYGVSPSQYITQTRISRAKQLMQYPFLSLEECAYQSGFSSLAYFSRVFRKVVGLSPAAYRKSIKQQSPSDD